MRFKGESHGDYMSFHCTECGGDVAVEFLGYDPSMPRFRFACRGCDAHGDFKMHFQHWSGLPRKAATPSD